ncbi:MAG: UDP-2,3-diacylglucosamine diphosphatase [Candidatus Hydrogenedens sp.]|nr:UDP-2,3-diacylglucosamine diphosphatase [Candidatus Hydrogenedens sp.]
MIFDLILSDIHLKVGEENLPRRKEFEIFLRGLCDNPPRKIVCLGDIFDFWFEYKHVLFSDYFGVLSAFHELYRQGVELFFIGGNHDFWAGKTLEQIGFHVLESGTTIEFDHCKAMLIHGDGLNKKDIGYRIFKRFARNRLMIYLFRMVHPDCAMGIAKLMSKGSRELQKADINRHQREAEIIKKYAIEILHKTKYDAVISGHCHQPECSTLTIDNRTCWYINAGDWIENNTFVKWDGKQFSICRYKPNKD